jgi:hypothetical protein
MVIQTIKEKIVMPIKILIMTGNVNPSMAELRTKRCFSRRKSALRKQV